MPAIRRAPELFPHDLEVMGWLRKSYVPQSHKYRDLCRKLVKKGYAEECESGIFSITPKGLTRVTRFEERGR